MVNMLASFVQGQAAGQAQRDRRVDQERTQQLNALAPQIIGGDPGAYAQAAAIDPAAAGQYQQSGDAIVRRARGAAKYLHDAVQSGDPARIAAANRTVKPFMDTLSPGNAYPEQWDPAMAPNLEAFLAKTAYIEQATGGTPASLQEFQAMTAGLPDEEVKRARRINLGLDPRASSAAIMYRQVEGPDGRMRWMAMSPREVGAIDLSTGEAIGAGVPSPYGSPAAPAAQRQSAPVLQQGQGQQLMDQIAASANQMIAAGIPADQVDAWAAQQMGGGTIREGGGNQLQTTQAVVPMRSAGGLPPPLDYQGGGNLVSMSPAEKAAAEAAAKAQVELSYLPAMGQVEAQNAALKEGVVQSAKSSAEQAAAQTVRATDAGNTLDLLAQAEGLLPSATGSLAGSVRDAAMGAVGRSTEGAQATAALQTIAGQLIGKMPRFEGPQSDKDVLLYRQMAGDLANPRLPVETRMAALRTIRSLNQKAAGQRSSATQGGAPVRVQSADDYNRLPSGAMYIAPDGTQRRKR